MLVEQLIRETLEMQGFRIESVNKAGSELVVTSFLICVTIPAAGFVAPPATTGIRSLKDAFAMCRCGRYQLPWSMLPAVTCPRCKSVHVESMPWAAGKKRLTKAFAVAIATWAGHYRGSKLPGIFSAPGAPLQLPSPMWLPSALPTGI